MDHKTKDYTSKTWVFPTLQSVIVILSIAVGFFGHRFILQYREDLGLLRQARDILNENSILTVPDQNTLEHGMIRGMLGTLDDPYTHFVEPAVHEVQSDQLTGHFGGVGLHLEMDLDMNWRIYPLPESPALAAGLQDADLLLFVEDLPITTELDEVTIIAAIRGPVGEKVTLSVLRNTEVLTFSIPRETIPLPSVTQHLLPDAPQIGMVQIHRIADTTADEIHNSVEALRVLGADAIILDLRDNGGGLVEAGIRIAKLFLSEGEIMHRKIRNQKFNVFIVDQPGGLVDLPLVLLINGNTASAAEIVAGAIKAHQRAPLIGSPTHGKTSIQHVFELQDGSSIHITSGKWWHPDVTFPLEPDYLITDDPLGIEIINQAIAVLGY